MAPSPSLHQFPASSCKTCRLLRRVCYTQKECKESGRLLQHTGAASLPLQLLLLTPRAGTKGPLPPAECMPGALGGAGCLPARLAQAAGLALRLQQGQDVACGVQGRGAGGRRRGEGGLGGWVQNKCS